MLLVLLASLSPTIIVSISLYFLIFGVTADQIGMPETIAYNLIPAAKKVILILVLSLPVLITTIMYFSHKIAHMIIGPFDRIIRELDECTNGMKKSQIYVRENDKFKPLVEKINSLLERFWEK